MLPAILIDNNILKSPALNLIMSTNPFQIYCLKKKYNKTIGLIVFLYSVIMLVWSPSSMPADGNNEVLTLNNKIFCEDFTYWKISFFMPGKEFGDSESPVTRINHAIYRVTPAGSSRALVHTLCHKPQST